MALTREQQIAALEKDWAENPRWKGVTRTYTAADVVRLRGSVQPEHTFARQGAEKLWKLVTEGAHPSFRPEKDFVNCMGALTGGQAVQQVKAGIQAIYLSGWQVAADNNSAESMYPDQSLYPVDSVPTVVKRINNSFRRADQIQWKAGKNPGDEGYIDYFAPIVADAEAGFGGVLNAYELMKSMIEAGAAGVHFEDQLASVKKCGHMGGKVLVPTQEAVQKLTAARLAADSPDHHRLRTHGRCAPDAGEQPHSHCRTYGHRRYADRSRGWPVSSPSRSRASGSPRSGCACCPATVARSGCRGWWARRGRCTSARGWTWRRTSTWR